jgi:hypothetical protein
MAERVTDSCTPLLGIGAMASERYAPAGLLIERHGRAIMIGGGLGAEPDRPVEDWLVTDERAELIAKIRRMAREKFSVRPRAGSASLDDLRIDAEPVVHTSRATYGYRLQLGNSMAAWGARIPGVPQVRRSCEDHVRRRRRLQSPLFDLPSALADMLRRSTLLRLHR